MCYKHIKLGVQFFNFFSKNVKLIKIIDKIVVKKFKTFAHFEKKINLFANML